MDAIRKLLGHRNVKTTDGYVHYEAEQLRPVLALLGTPTPTTREAQDFSASTKRAQEPEPISYHPGNSLN
jgi:hypothetical protein